MTSGVTVPPLHRPGCPGVSAHREHREHEMLSPKAKLPVSSFFMTLKTVLGTTRQTQSCKPGFWSLKGKSVAPQSPHQAFRLEDREDIFASSLHTQGCGGFYRLEKNMVAWHQSLESWVGFPGLLTPDRAPG